MMEAGGFGDDVIYKIDENLIKIKLKVKLKISFVPLPGRKTMKNPSGDINHCIFGSYNIMLIVNMMKMAQGW